MKNRQSELLLGVCIASFVILFSCKKINEATELGGGLIPTVDNITTFDTTLSVETYNDIFALLNDSTQSFGSDEHFLGKIENDPIFGKTDARIFLELKPTSYKYSFLNRPDSVHIDSVVLVLDYKETYGDTMVPQTINVYEVDQSSDFRVDSNYFINRNTFTYTNMLGSKTIIPSQLKDSVKVYLDTTKSQLRIPLSSSFANRIQNFDSTAGVNGAFYSDSAFRTKFKGFALQSVAGGNAIMGFDLEGANTKLAIYYRYDKNGVMNFDTTVTYWGFTGISASANYIQRDHSGTQVLSTAGGGADDLVYIQSTPGTFTTIKIPALGTLSNRLVHRAELIMEQVYDASDTMFPPPSFLFVDAYDASVSKFRTLPYDVQPDASGALNLASFGVTPFNTLDGSGRIVKTWRFNFSRYVQHVLTQTLPLYEFRLFAPYYVREQYGIPPILEDVTRLLYVNSTFGKGRVRLAGGGPVTNPQRMRLRIIYSKI